MTQEEKNLLLRDLCIRLPYGVIIEHEGNLSKLDTIFMCDSISISSTSMDKKLSYNLDLDEIKPYLFPLSSMTEEQKRELKDLISRETKILIEQLKTDDYGIDCGKYHFNQVLELEWLLKNHFDYRGLIEKGLAIKVNKSNNPYKE